MKRTIVIDAACHYSDGDWTVVPHYDGYRLMTRTSRTSTLHGPSRHVPDQLDNLRQIADRAIMQCLFVTNRLKSNAA